jgi:siderophore synthetase component
VRAAAAPERHDTLPPPLRQAYLAELPGARASVLARLYGALSREPIPGVRPERLHANQDVARPFAVARPGLVVTVDDHPYTDPALLVAALDLPGHGARLAAELANSVANLALARAAQPPPDPASALSPVLAEQSIVDGHPLHPCCRTRLGLSPAEVLAYAPEHRPLVHLVLVEVPAGRWLSTGDSPVPPLLPVHPWQWSRLRDEYPWLRPTGTTIAARPLMSLRTLAIADDPNWHLKTALDVQMTSAVRTVSPAAVRNGPAVSTLLARLAGRTTGLSVLREVAAGAAVHNGEPLRSLAFIRREAPRAGPGEVVVPLAALAAPSPIDGRPLVTGCADGFLTALVPLLLRPLLTLLHLGVGLEAHGQNTLVVLDSGRPVRLLYRDVGGVRVSPRRLAGAGIECPPLFGDLGTDDPEVLRTKVFASALSTVVGELVAVLAREHGTPETRSWDVVAAAAREVCAELPAAAATGLFGPTLPVKAMTAMRLAADPLHEQWTALPNPLAGAR